MNNLKLILNFINHSLLYRPPIPLDIQCYITSRSHTYPETSIVQITPNIIYIFIINCFKNILKEYGRICCIRGLAIWKTYFISVLSQWMFSDFLSFTTKGYILLFGRDGLPSLHMETYSFFYWYIFGTFSSNKAMIFLILNKAMKIYMRKQCNSLF